MIIYTNYPQTSPTSQQLLSDQEPSTKRRRKESYHEPSYISYPMREIFESQVMNMDININMRRVCLYCFHIIKSHKNHQKIFKKSLFSKP